MHSICVRLAPALLVGASAALPQSAAATDGPAVVSTTAALPAQAPQVSPGADIPALTPVSLEILAPLGSKLSETGDSFPIRLAAPISLNGREIVPSGATGMGEVVHAKKGGGMGAPGELVLAARYLEVDGRRLKLRSLRVAGAGKSNIDTVNAINVGSAVSPIPFGLIGFFVSGGQIAIPAGAIADAKVAEPFPLAHVPTDSPASDAASTTVTVSGPGVTEP